ncbi:MAG TPA: prepilin-type N-terminal cleavage/methylation domain-containing protein [Candidatus Paceibacterota bacterium]
MLGQRRNRWGLAPYLFGDQGGKGFTPTSEECRGSLLSWHPSDVGAKPGFTLIELLVVIAIITILSSVVLTSLSDARRNSRDAKRIGDVKQIQLALELFYDSQSSYPTTLSALKPVYIPTLPKDPSTGAFYSYAALGTGTGGACPSYHLGATLEKKTHKSLDDDADADASGTICSGTNFDGSNDAVDGIFDFTD